MSLAITPENSNTLNVTNESKVDATTWNEMDILWDEAAGTWDNPGTPFINETKNSLTITNENV